MMKPDDLITKSDLENFKQELLKEIREFVDNHQQKPLLNNADLQELLGLSYSTLQNLRVSGELPFTRLGGTIFYFWEDVIRVMQERKSA